MLCISKTRADSRNLLQFLESASQIHSETNLTFEKPKCLSGCIKLIFVNKKITIYKTETRRIYKTVKSCENSMAQTEKIKKE